MRFRFGKFVWIPAVVMLVAAAPVDGRAPVGTVVWKADAELALNQEWAEYSTPAHCAVDSNTVSSDANAFRETTVVAKGKYAYGFVYNPANTQCYGHRAEIGQGLPERPGFNRRFNQGDDRWNSFQVMLGSDWPISNINWNNIVQWKQNPSSTHTPYPMLTLQAHGGAFYLDYIGVDQARLATAVLGRWAKFSFHIVFSTNPSVGLVEVWGDPDGKGMRQLLAPLHEATLAADASGVPVPSNVRIGIYRNDIIPGTAHLYFDGFTAATTRAAAEANAF